jgi:hypothetical protein
LLFKDHTGIMQRIKDRHQEFLDANNNKDSSGSSAKLITFIIFLFAVTCTIGYIMIHKRLKFQRLQKANSNYRNLIESEFDT